MRASGSIAMMARRARDRSLSACGRPRGWQPERLTRCILSRSIRHETDARARVCQMTVRIAGAIVISSTASTRGAPAGGESFVVERISCAYIRTMQINFSFRCSLIPEEMVDSSFCSYVFSSHTCRLTVTEKRLLYLPVPLCHGNMYRHIMLMHGYWSLGSNQAVSVGDSNARHTRHTRDAHACSFVTSSYDRIACRVRMRLELRVFSPFSIARDPQRTTATLIIADTHVTLITTRCNLR